MTDCPARAPAALEAVLEAEVSPLLEVVLVRDALLEDPVWAAEDEAVVPEVERAGVTLRAGAAELVPDEAADDADEAEVPGVTVLLAVVPEAAELLEVLLPVLAEVPADVLLLGAAVVLRLAVLVEELEVVPRRTWLSGAVAAEVLLLALDEVLAVLRLTPALLAPEETLDDELLEALAEVPAEVLLLGAAEVLLLGVDAEELLETPAEEPEEALREALEADLFCEELAVVVEVPRLA